MQAYSDLERAGKAPRRPTVVWDLLVSALRVHVETLRDPSYEFPISRSDSTRGPHMEGFTRDLRLALRGLLRAPGFSAKGLVRVAAGLALGVGTAFLLTRFLEGLIFGVERFDPWTYLGVTALLLATAVAACWWPAVRASAVAPAEVLKED